MTWSDADGDGGDNGSDVDGPQNSEARTSNSEHSEPQSDGSNAEPARSVGGYFRDLVELTKPRIVTMILVTTACTAIIGRDGPVAVDAMIALLFLTAMVAASAGAANQIWERKIDRAMPRTRRRPMPDGRLSLTVAVAFCGVLLAAGTIGLYQRFSIAPAMFGLATWVAYVFVYTPLKVRTTLNTAVGAIAGALPVMIGYTATGGSTFGLTGWLLFAVLAAWQFPHFMAIAWMYRDQYGEAGFRMTPSVYRDGRSAAIQAIVGSGVLMVAAATLVCVIHPPVDTASWIYVVVAMVATTAAAYPMLAASIRFARRRTDESARSLLRSSLLVLPAVLLVATVGVLV